MSASVFYGLGADGTVGANKNSIKIIGQETDLYAQGYFVYDSKKSGAITVSHLRTSKQPIRSAYLVNRAGFVACHQFEFVDKIDVLEHGGARRGVPAERAVCRRPRSGITCRRRCRSRSSRRRSASSRSTPTTWRSAPGWARASTRSCRRASSRSPACCRRDEAITHIKKAIEKTYGKRGPGGRAPQLRGRGSGAGAPARDSRAGARSARRAQPSAAGLRARARLRAEGDRGDPGGQRRSAAGQRVSRGRHVADRPRRNGRSATSRSRFRSGTPRSASSAISARWCARTPPSARRSTTRARSPARRRRSSRRRYRATNTRASASRSRSRPRTAPAATSASTSVPAKDRDQPEAQGDRHAPAGAAARRRARELRLLPQPARARSHRRSPKLDHKSSQFLEPLFEYSGACAGCGETPYLKLLTQLFGDRLLIANATGCSSIYGGNLPTTPYTTNRDGRGPAWSNSLFEDNAEFGFGFRMALDGARRRGARPAPAPGAADRRAAWHGASSTRISRTRPASPRSASA